MKFLPGKEFLPGWEPLAQRIETLYFQVRRQLFFRGTAKVSRNHGFI